MGAAKAGGRGSAPGLSVNCDAGSPENAGPSEIATEIRLHYEGTAGVLQCGRVSYYKRMPLVRGDA